MLSVGAYTSEKVVTCEVSTPTTWQQSWDRETRCIWTTHLINYVRPMFSRKQYEVNYFLNQLLSRKSTSPDHLSCADMIYGACQASFAIEGGSAIAIACRRKSGKVLRTLYLWSCSRAKIRGTEWITLKAFLQRKRRSWIAETPG